MNYKFYCSILGVQTEVFPQNFKSGTKFLWEQQDEEIFTRLKLDGNLLFTNIPKEGIADFDYFYAIEQSADRCEEISLLIKRQCNKNDLFEDYWNGYFSINDGIFEIDSCIFSVKISPDDKYRCYIENSENEYNINQVPHEIDTTLNVTESYEFYTCRDTAVNCNASRPEPATQWLVFHTEIVDGITTTIYYREVIVTACQGGLASPPPSGTWFQVMSYGDCVNGFAKWARTPVNVVQNNPNPNVSAGNCLITNDATPPPRKKIITITKSASTPTPIITGPDQLDLINCFTGIIWRVPNNPGSTYAWTITGSGNVINSGAATNEINCDIANAGSVKVVETTSCGASTQAVLSFTNDAQQQIANFQVYQRSRVCFGSISYITFNYPLTVIASLNMIDVGSTGSSLIQIDSTTWQFTAGNSAGDVTFFFSGGTCFFPNLSNPSKITVGKNIQTPDIEGLQSVCESQTLKYKVAYLDATSYGWIVTGGAIISGQGTNEITVTWDGLAGSGAIELIEEGCDCGWILIEPCGPSGEPPYYWCPDVTPVTIIKTKLLSDILDFVSTQICGCHSCANGVNLVVSDFLNINPIGDSPGYVAGYNYVTGQLNKLSFITLTAKEVVLNATVLDNKGVFKWSMLTKMLRDVFELYWFVDDNYNVRFEHITFFQRVVKFDLTSVQYLKWKKRTKYFYEKVKMPKYERFEWMEAAHTDFVGAEIRYDSVCVSSDPKSNVNKINADKFTTDILFVSQSPGDIDPGGFIMLVNDFNGTNYTVSTEKGLITDTFIVNAHLSWANLHYNYHRYNRVLLEGSMNVMPTNFFTTKRYKKQEDISFPFCCTDTLDTLQDLITTVLGNGVVASAELTNKDNMIKVTLLYQ